MPLFNMAPTLQIYATFCFHASDKFGQIRTFSDRAVALLATCGLLFAATITDKENFR